MNMNAVDTLFGKPRWRAAQPKRTPPKGLDARLLALGSAFTDYGSVGWLERFFILVGWESALKRFRRMED